MAMKHLLRIFFQILWKRTGRRKYFTDCKFSNCFFSSLTPLLIVNHSYRDLQFLEPVYGNKKPSFAEFMAPGLIST